MKSLIWELKSKDIEGVTSWLKLELKAEDLANVGAEGGISRRGCCMQEPLGSRWYFLV